jgi:hypothetical protein
MLLLTHLPKTSEGGMKAVVDGGGAGSVVGTGAGAVLAGGASVEKTGATVVAGGAAEVCGGASVEKTGATVVAGGDAEVWALATSTMQHAARSTMSTTLKSEMKLRRNLLQASSFTIWWRLIMGGMTLFLSRLR